MLGDRTVVEGGAVVEGWVVLGDRAVVEGGAVVGGRTVVVRKAVEIKRQPHVHIEKKKSMHNICYFQPHERSYLLLSVSQPKCVSQQHWSLSRCTLLYH